MVQFTEDDRVQRIRAPEERLRPDRHQAGRHHRAGLAGEAQEKKPAGLAWRGLRPDLSPLSPGCTPVPSNKALGLTALGFRKEGV